MTLSGGEGSVLTQHLCFDSKNASPINTHLDMMALVSPSSPLSVFLIQIGPVFPGKNTFLKIYKTKQTHWSGTSPGKSSWIFEQVCQRDPRHAYLLRFHPQPTSLVGPGGFTSDEALHS